MNEANQMQIIDAILREGNPVGLQGRWGMGFKGYFHPSVCLMASQYSHLFLCIIKVESREHFLEQLLYARHKTMTVALSHLKQLYGIITIIIVINLIAVKDSKIQWI